MKKTLYALIAAVTITMASTPTRAGYWDTAVYTQDASIDAASGYYNAALHLLYADNYNQVDWGLLYNAWIYAGSASDGALYAYYSAPRGSHAGTYAFYAYYYLAVAADNIYYSYLYQGQVPSYEENALINAYYGQIYLAYAALAAAGRY